jgi:isoleucyl-tRNA synthetase
VFRHCVIPYRGPWSSSLISKVTFCSLFLRVQRLDGYDCTRSMVHRLVIGSDLVGATYQSIFATTSPASLKVIPASHVTADSGTGLVHCAPAHGAEDYHAFQAMGLLDASNEMICHVDGEGKFSASIAGVVGEEAAKTLVGQEVLGGGSKAVVKLLEKKGDALLKVQRIKHRYPYDWKTKQPIIVTYVYQEEHRLRIRLIYCFYSFLFEPP